MFQNSSNKSLSFFSLARSTGKKNDLQREPVEPFYSLIIDLEANTMHIE